MTGNTKRWRNFSESLMKSFCIQFGKRPIFYDYTPKFMCQGCCSTLYAVKEKPNANFYTTATHWKQSVDHPNDCIFCMINMDGVRYEAKTAFDFPPSLMVTPTSLKEYITVNKTINTGPLTPINTNVGNGETHNRRVKITNEESVNEWLEVATDSEDENNDNEENTDEHDENYCPPKKRRKCGKIKPKLITKDIHMNMAKSLAFDITKQQNHARILKSLGLLDKSCKVSDARTRSYHLHKYFDTNQHLAFCCDIEGLFGELGAVHSPVDWRLFIDSGGKTLKVMLIHNQNVFPSVPIALAFSSRIKESYQSTKLILESIKYAQYQWSLCCDLKLVCFLQGLQGGNTTNPCFLCLFCSRDKENHYINHQWAPRVDEETGKNNRKYEPLVSSEKIIIPPLHLKLGFAMQFIKTILQTKKKIKCELEEEEEEEPDDVEQMQRAIKLEALKAIFPRKTESKITNGIVTGPEIKKLFENKDFVKVLNPIELQAFKCLIDICCNFLGKFSSLM